MKEMMEYLRANPAYVIALAVTAAVLVAACILGFFIKKYNLLRFMDGWFKKKGAPTDDAPADAEAAPNSDSVPMSASSDDASMSASSVGDNSPEVGSPQPDSGEIQAATGAEQEKLSKFSQLVRSSAAEFAEEHDEEPSTPIDTVVPASSAKETRADDLRTVDEDAYYISGMWKIVLSGSTYSAELWDFDGVLMMRSQSYSASSDAIKAIDSLINYVSGNNFKVDVKHGKFYFKLLSPSGRLMCRGEPCDTNEECIRRIEIVKHIASRAEIVKG